MQIFFPYWIYNELIEEREIEMLGKVTDEDKKNVKKMFIIALWCIQLNPNDRPSMDRVIDLYSGINCFKQQNRALKMGNIRYLYETFYFPAQRN